MMQRLLAVIMALTLVSEVRAASEVDVVRAAIARADSDPDLSALAAWEEAAAKARAWAPELSLEARREESLGSDSAFTTDVLGLGVGIELSSRNQAARAEGAAQAAAARRSREVRILDAVSGMRALALEAWAASGEARAVSRSLARLEELRTDLAELVEGGEHARFDLDVLDVALDARRREARQAAALEASLRRELASLSGLEVHAIDLAPLGDAAEAHVESLIARHPALLELEAQALSAAARAQLAAGEGAPRLGVMAAWRRDDEPLSSTGDGYEVGVALTLPTPSMRAPAVARARAEEFESRARLERARILLLSRAEAALSRIEGLEPAAPQRVDAESLLADAEARYRSGEGSLSELLSIAEATDARAGGDRAAELELRRARLALDHATGLATAPVFLALLPTETSP